MAKKQKAEEQVEDVELATVPATENCSVTLDGENYTSEKVGEDWVLKIPAEHVETVKGLNLGFTPYVPEFVQEVQKGSAIITATQVQETPAVTTTPDAPAEGAGIQPAWTAPKID